MWNEITSEDASLSFDELMNKYQYVDGHACLVNPMFENRRHNLVRNGNGEEGMSYWKTSIPNTFPGRVDGKFRIDNGTGSGNLFQMIPVKKNTNYYISANLFNISATAAISVMKTDMATHIRSYTPGTFNTGDNDTIVIMLHTGGAGAADFDSIMLIEGTTAPTAYKSQDLQRFVVEGRFERGNKIHIENKEVSGTRLSKYRVLYGKDYDWKFDDTALGLVGLKRIRIDNETSVFQNIITTNVLTDIGHVMIKYDSKILNGSVEPTANTDAFLAHKGTNAFYLSMANADTGWAELINPTNDEVKAFMNGWKAIQNNGTRYITWISVIDGSYPAGAVSSTITAASITSTITVANGSLFAVGDYVSFHLTSAGTYGWYSILAVSGNTITLNGATDVQANTQIIKIDNGSTNVSLLNWCRTNVAPGYEGYRLTYKLDKPEPITDVNIHIHGEIWDFVKGDNHVRIEPGIVLDEIATVVSIGTTYYINRNPLVGDPNPASSQLKNQVEQFLGQYRNGVYDNSWAVDGIVPYGKVRLTAPQASVDPSAIYKVDYQILKTIHAQAFSSLSLSYRQSILNTLNGYGKDLEQKQPRDSVLDNLIDLSMYEEISGIRFFCHGRASKYNTNAIYAYGYFTAFPKKVTPIVTLRNAGLSYNNGTGNSIQISSSDVTIIGTYIKGGLIKITAIYTGTDTTIQNNLLNYGYSMFLDSIIADCRGRV
jgi:hypothetical protein